ncbi:uncharacterized protein LOC144100793 isoform X2 [Amblyomma americanum]
MFGRRASTSLSSGKWRLLMSAATLLCALSDSSLALEVKVTNDGPSILDSTITFRAELLGGEFSTLFYVFEHNVPTAAQPEMITNGTVAVLPMAFLSNKDLPGEYVMRVTVLKEYFFTKHRIAQGSCNFKLTRDIVGRIMVSQDGHVLPDNQTIVKTNRTTNFTFELHDPSGYFKSFAWSLSWKLDYGISQYAPYFTVNFTDSEVHCVRLIVVALVNRPSSTSPQIKVGVFARSVTPKEVHVTNNGPAILDSTITFQAELLASGFPNVRYVFRHNVPSASQPEIITNGTQAVLPMTFLSTRDQPGEYLMVVSVLEEGPTNRKIAEGSCQFSLTRNIVGKIMVSQGGHVLPDNQTIISANQTTSFTFDLHDPGRFFNSSFKAMSWKS